MDIVQMVLTGLKECYRGRDHTKPNKEGHKARKVPPNLTGMDFNYLFKTSKRRQRKAAFKMSSV